MATEVEAYWLLGEYFLQAVGRALPLCNVNLDLGRMYTFSDFDELFGKV